MRSFTLPVLAIALASPAAQATPPLKPALKEARANLRSHQRVATKASQAYQAFLDSFGTGTQGKVHDAVAKALNVTAVAAEQASRRVNELEWKERFSRRKDKQQRELEVRRKRQSQYRKMVAENNRMARNPQNQNTMDTLVRELSLNDGVARAVTIGGAMVSISYDGHILELATDGKAKNASRFYNAEFVKLDVTKLDWIDQAFLELPQTNRLFAIRADSSTQGGAPSRVITATFAVDGQNQIIAVRHQSSERSGE